MPNIAPRSPLMPSSKKAREKNRDWLAERRNRQRCECRAEGHEKEKKIQRERMCLGGKRRSRKQASSSPDDVRKFTLSRPYNIRSSSRNIFFCFFILSFWRTNTVRLYLTRENRVTQTIHIQRETVVRWRIAIDHCIWLMNDGSSTSSFQRHEQPISPASMDFFITSFSFSLRLSQPYRTSFKFPFAFPFPFPVFDADLLVNTHAQVITKEYPCIYYYIARSCVYRFLVNA